MFAENSPVPLPASKMGSPVSPVCLAVMSVEIIRIVTPALSYTLNASFGFDIAKCDVAAFAGFARGIELGHWPEPF